MSDKTCFFISSIGMSGSEVKRRSDQIYTYVVMPAAQRLGYKTVRVAQESGAQYLTASIIQHILDAEIVVADLSDMNPNVMYELGVRHAAGKPAIHISTLGTRIPFDVANLRVIIIDITDIDSITSAAHNLSAAITEIENNPNESGSPVLAALDVKSFQKLNKKETEPDSKEFSSTVVNVLKDIENRLKTLEHAVT